MFGDFNEILHLWKKLSEHGHQQWLIDEFRTTMLHYDLMDLGFHGNPFTWSNNRVNQLVHTHLYQGLVNQS